MNDLKRTIGIILFLFSTYCFAQTDIDIEQLTLKANSGNVSFQVSLATRYYFGDGVQQDYSMARQYFEKAAAKEHAQAQYFLGQIYAQGLDVQQDDTIARQWFEKSCQNGYRDACIFLETWN